MRWDLVSLLGAATVMLANGIGSPPLGAQVVGDRAVSTRSVTPSQISRYPSEFNGQVVRSKGRIEHFTTLSPIDYRQSTGNQVGELSGPSSDCVVYPHPFTFSLVDEAGAVTVEGLGPVLPTHRSRSSTVKKSR